MDPQADLSGALTRLPRLAALVLALALGARPAEAASPSVEPPEALLVHSFVEPAPAPPVVLTDADGRRLTLDQFRGRVVFLNFWATWCAPCLTEMPAMERLHRTYRDRGLAIVAVNFKESPRQVQDFMRKHDLTFAALLDADGATSVALRIIGLPVTFLLDREGRILWRAIGAREWDTPLVRAYLERLLGAP